MPRTPTMPTVKGNGIQMSLGAHLEELRWRLMTPMLLFVVMVMVGFGMSAELKILFEAPLRQALTMVDDDVLKSLGLVDDPEVRILTALSLVESPINAIKISVFAALLVTFPFFIYQLWRFVTPALSRKERSAGFWIVPAAVIFFIVARFLVILLAYRGFINSRSTLPRTIKF